MTSGAGTHAQARQKRALASAVLLSGAGEVVDFLLPLFAGAAIGLSPSQIGMLLAVELAVSLVVRPLAGSMADRFERRNIAAAGAMLYAVSCAGYAIAPGATVAYVAAAIGGVGGALLWVSLRALVGEGLAEDSGVFAKLVSAEETGSWAIFIPVFVLIDFLGYQGVFLALAACCASGAILLATAPRARDPVSSGGARPDSGKVPGQVGLLRGLSPMLLAVALMMIAEGAISLLLLLHLQQEFELEPLQIGLVFLPGGIAMGVLPPYLHGLVRRYGRTRMLAGASVASAGFAASLAFAPNPVVIAVCWVLAGVAWAVVFPVQQAVIAEASGETRLGRGLGWYESATLAGALVGTLAAGFLYELGSWQIACLVATAVILSGAVIVPAAVRALGVTQYPSDPEPLVPDRPAEAPDGQRAGAREAEGAKDGPDAEDEANAEEPEPTRGEFVSSISWHTAILIGAMAIAHLFIDGARVTQVFSSAGLPPEPFSVDTTVDWIREQIRAGGIAMVLRVWIIVWIVDLVRTLCWKLPKAPHYRSDQSTPLERSSLDGRNDPIAMTTDPHRDDA